MTISKDWSLFPSAKVRKETESTSIWMGEVMCRTYRSTALLWPLSQLPTFSLVKRYCELCSTASTALREKIISQRPTQAAFFQKGPVSYLTASEGGRAGCVIVCGVCKIVGEIGGDIRIGGLALARQLLQVLCCDIKVRQVGQEVNNGENK